MKLARLAALIFITLFAAACVVENEHTIVTEQLKPDDRIDGVWTMETGGSVTVLIIGREDENSTQLRGRLIVSDKKETMVSWFEMTFTEIGGRKYFEANNLGGDAPFKPQVKRFFALWQIGEDGGSRTLKLCFASPDEFKVVIEKKILPGYVGPGSNPRTILASSTEATRAYLEKTPLNCEAGLVQNYRRITGPKQERK